MTVLTRDQVLRAVLHCQRDSPDGTARTSCLAARLGVTGPSVTARVQELAAAELVRYAPRQGATLTEEGERQAQESLRKLRQLEQFLRVVLGLPSDVCAVEAEDLLRHISEMVIEAVARHISSLSS